MSVFYDDRRRDSGYETRATSRDPRAAQGVFGARTRPARRRPEDAEAPPPGLLRQRAEDLIQIVLAFALVGGATALLHSSLVGAPPAPAPLAAVASGTRQAPVEAEMVTPEALPTEAPPTEIPPPPPSAADSVPASFFDARPIAGRTGEEAEEAPRPLAPPSAEMREKLAAENIAAENAAGDDAVAVRESSPLITEEPAAPSVREAAGAAGSGRPAKCFLKVSGRVQANGACRIRQSDGEVAFQFADRTLTLAHEHGRVWTATMGGRALGRVYQVRRGRCWGSRGPGFYACDNS